MSDIDRLLAVVASRQHGVFSNRQAVAAGATRRQIEYRRSTGAWIDLDYAVYALDSSPPTWQRQVMAAVLTKNRARASGITSGVLHGMANCRKGRPEITVPASGNAPSRLAVVRRRTDFTSLKLVLINRIPTFDVPTTLFDLASRLPASQLERTIDDCLVRSKVNADELRSVLSRYSGCRLAGTVAFREAIGEITDAYVPSESDLEGLLLRVLDDPRVPQPQLQARLSWWQELPHRIDACIDPWTLIIEADGRTYHTKRADFENDRRRDNLAVAHGYRVLRFTYRMLNDDPTEVLRIILRAGAQSAGEIDRV
ncbi:MAG: endonuclease domain-containing protein [Actinomycetia bacterium]|nr:endonuclease domain-containing protein [Actinomycetes bacterium]